jgi:hypothetical protein
MIELRLLAMISFDEIGRSLSEGIYHPHRVSTRDGGLVNAYLDFRSVAQRDERWK